MNMARFFLLVIGLLSLHGICCGQKTDTLPIIRKQHTESPYKIDTLARHSHNPRKATLYSTFFPGLGQIYNRKYWKVPIVWAAVGIPAYLYFDNKKWYDRCQYAISVIDTYQGSATGVPDSVFKKVDPKLQPFVTNGDDNSLRNYRNEYRKDEDYSILFFILFWGLNIVDATVDAHLMNFDVGNELSLHLDHPSSNAMVRGPMGPGMGLSLLVDFHKPKYKALAALP
ncbi:DUF5683 domain-containing protein [Puia dinghuensis]|uniref:DUF5683 domain-containing protein n=1 Tax=Puia dinghuensis TaxID=1792502 RepID=A0A8J2XRI8_9BACT|nr:DUF5683 domain-containing protein [Puia dinghuensis]GGA87096.1 hypothetical protein GCM10011511_07750 [Puia dinghuensis]